MTSAFDKFANDYGSFHDTPVSKYFFEPTLLRLLGDVTGKSVLDLGCGEGYYSRLIKQKGASRVLGVDISSLMIETAKGHEEVHPLGIEYIRSDIARLRHGTKFDVVFMMLVLPFAKDQGHLTRMFRVAFNHLTPGGSLVVITCIPQSPRDCYSFRELGIEIVSLGARNDAISAVVQLRSTLDPKLVLMAFDVALYDADTYKRCSEKAGFGRVEIRPVVAVVPDSVFFDDKQLFKNINEAKFYQAVTCQKRF